MNHSRESFNLRNGLRDMGIEVREATSDEMKKNIRTVKKMTNGMGFDENMESVNWKMVRRISSFGYKFMPKEKGVKFSKVMLGRTKGILSEPKEISSNTIILYIHGGGFVSGSAASSKGYSSMLANYSGCRVYAIDYSLSPENAFPTALDDCYEAIVNLKKMYPDSKIAVAGESAGANLCIALALKTKEAGLVSCAIVHSPIIDFSGALDRSKRVIDDFTVKEGCLIPLRKIYVGDHDVKEPLISPLYGDFSGFTPTFISCDHSETLASDAYCLYDRLEQSGVEVEMVVMKDTFHAFATIGTGTPETKKLLEDNIRFMKSVMG